MKFKSLRLTPNIIKFMYDFGYLYLIILMILILSGKNLVDQLILFCMPVIFIFIGLFSGIYSRKNTHSINYKCLILILPSSVTSILIYYLINVPSIAFFWFLMSYINLIIPRLIININNSKSSLNYIINLRGPILVIGGAGYIGSHLINILINSGKSVRVLDRLMFGGSSLSIYKDNPNFEMIEGDTTDIECLTNAMRGAYAVIHLSGLVGDPACAVDATLTRHQNIIATRLIKSVAKAMRVNRLIFSSSCSVYGVSDFEVTETDKLNPVSLYAKTKIDSEIELLKSNQGEPIVTILRFATVFGDSPRPRFDLVANLFAAQAYVEKKITIIGPDQWRPFIHVEDLAKSINIVLNASTKKINNQIFNVGDSRLNMTLGQLGEKVREVARNFSIDLEVKIMNAQAQDKRNYAVSFQKIKNVLGFEASIMMEEGLLDIIKKFESGVYNDYTNEIYSNLLVTKKFKPIFYSLNEREKLYAPVSEFSNEL